MPNEKKPVYSNVERLFFEAGYVCFTTVHPYLCHRCGYVVVPEGHPLYGMDDAFDDNVTSIQVHGGVTFLGGDSGCWIVGFDMAHLGDAPDLSLRGDDGGKLDDYFNLFGHGYVWTADDAEDETRSLARELRSMA